MNIENLMKAVDYFEDEPLRLDMQHWVQTRKRVEALAHTLRNPPCGTVACLCGSAMIMEAKRLNCTVEALYATEGYEEIGMRLFDITEEQANNLFYVNRWPEPYATFYYHLHNEFGRADNPDLLSFIKKQMVFVLRQRVEHFIRETKMIATLQQLDDENDG